MDLLKTLLVYMSLAFVSSVQTAPEPVPAPEDLVTPTPYVEVTPVPTPEPTPVPTINITPNPAYKTLQMGDRGDLVRAMQEKLIEYGYLTGEADGAYGNQTRRAVESFQYQHGLSVDGIAGRRTLTVLYESNEIRLAPDVTATPAPTATSQLSVAITPSPTPAFVPIETVATAAPATPKPAATAAPSVEASEKDYAIVIANTGETLAAKPYEKGGMVYLPLIEIIRGAGMNVISSSSVEADEFAFAMNDDLYRIAYTENQAGDPINLEVYLNTTPQLLPERDILRAGEVIYLPASSVESIGGITVQTDDAAKTITVSVPLSE